MLKKIFNKLNEIHKYITEKRTEVDQIAEYMYHQTKDKCNFRAKSAIGRCRQFGINPDSKAGLIMAHLMDLYEDRGDIFEDKDNV